MIQDLTSDQRALAEYMSELSEDAYSAGWLGDLEYSLWRIVCAGSGRFGHIDMSGVHVSRLQELSKLCGGWIVFDDHREETFVNLEDWQTLYAERLAKGPTLRP